MLDDTIQDTSVFIIIDKPRIFKFSMLAIYQIEKKYKDINTAFNLLNLKNDTKTYILTVIDFLYYCVIPNASKEQIENWITVDNLIKATEIIFKAANLQFPNIEDKEPTQQRKDEAYDWDWLYYVGRYHLNMSDNEFWSCTLRRFLKLCKLWSKDNGITKDGDTKTDKKVYADTINW